MERADVVHVWADVGVRRVKGRLRPHRGVPLGRYPDEGDVGESRTSRQRRRPVGRRRAETTLQKKPDVFTPLGLKAATSLQFTQTRVTALARSLAAAPHSSKLPTQTFPRIKGGFHRRVLIRGNVRATGQQQPRFVTCT